MKEFSDSCHIYNLIEILFYFNPISNRIDLLKDIYSNIIKNTKTKYINCIL